MLFDCPCPLMSSPFAIQPSLCFKQHDFMAMLFRCRRAYHLFGHLAEQMSCQAPWMASADCPSAQHDTRLNKGLADRVAFARLFLVRCVVNDFQSGQAFEFVFVDMPFWCTTFSGTGATRWRKSVAGSYKCGELKPRHQLTGARNAMQCKRSMTSAD